MRSVCRGSGRRWSTAGAAGSAATRWRWCSGRSDFVPSCSKAAIGSSDAPSWPRSTSCRQRCRWSSSAAPRAPARACCCARLPSAASRCLTSRRSPTTEAPCSVSSPGNGNRRRRRSTPRYGMRFAASTRRGRSSSRARARRSATCAWRRCSCSGCGCRRVCGWRSRPTRAWAFSCASTTSSSATSTRSAPASTRCARCAAARRSPAGRRRRGPVASTTSWGGGGARSRPRGRARRAGRPLRPHLPAVDGAQLRRARRCAGPGRMERRRRDPGHHRRAGVRGGGRAQAAFLSQFSSCSEPPISSPLTNTCGTVCALATAPTTLLRTVCDSGTSA